MFPGVSRRAYSTMTDGWLSWRLGCIPRRAALAARDGIAAKSSGNSSPSGSDVRSGSARSASCCAARKGRWSATRHAAAVCDQRGHRRGARGAHGTRGVRGLLRGRGAVRSRARTAARAALVRRGERHDSPRHHAPASRASTSRPRSVLVCTLFPTSLTTCRCGAIPRCTAISARRRSHRTLLLNWFRARCEVFATRRAFRFRTPHAVKLALYHDLGALPEPESTHRFC